MTPKIEYTILSKAVVIALALMVSFPSSVQANDCIYNAESGPITYDELTYYALYKCKNNKAPSWDIIQMLIKVEKSFGPPPEMRGMILAAACLESGFNPNAKGDRKFSKNKKTPMAIGILQQWKIYEKIFPGMDRTNVESAATTWMQHIVNQIPKVKRQCKYRVDKKVWLAAWVTGVRYKKKGGRCKEAPTHYRLLKRWHAAIKRDRKACSSTSPTPGIDGC